MPHLADLYQEYRDKGLEVLVISHEPPELLKEYAAAMKLPFPVLSDARQAVKMSYGVNSIPFTLLIDREGKVATGLAGYSYSKFYDEFVPAVEQVVKG